MTLNLLIAPDFAPERFAGWHMLNTLLQKRSGLQLHLLTPASAAEQAQLIAEGKVDAVYANPFDAASMIRDAGYQPSSASIDTFTKEIASDYEKFGRIIRETGIKAE